jgi:hypothetical protein
MKLSAHYLRHLNKKDKLNKMRNYQKACDACGKILFGSNEGGKMAENHISIEGEMTKAVWNDEMQKHIFINCIKPERTYDFCDTDCLKKFLDEKETYLYDRIVRSIKDKGEYGYGAKPVEEETEF